VNGGENHLVNLVRAIVDGPNGGDTLIIVTYDEFGGQWDHVPPPVGQRHSGRSGTAPHDQWGPGTRIPALLIAQKFPGSGVDHTSYDTTSILKLIEERYHLAPLGSRDLTVTNLKRALDAAH
jgi:phospholipase C